MNAVALRRYTAVLTVVAYLHGCASPPISPGTNLPSGQYVLPRDILVTEARSLPEAKLDLVLRGKGELAAAGAGHGALEGAGAMLGATGGCGGGPYCAAAAILLLPFALGIGAVVGAVRDAPSGVAPEDIARGRTAMADSLARLDLPRRLRSAVAEEVRAQGVAASLIEEPALEPASPGEPTADTPVDPKVRSAILEAGVLGFQFERVPFGGKDVSYQLAVRTRVRLLSRESRTTLDELTHVYRSGMHTAPEWLSDEARRFEEALTEATVEAARSGVHEIFLVFHPDRLGESSEHELVPDYVLRPVYPLPVKSIDLAGAVSGRYRSSWGGLKFVPVDDRQPTLRWEAFPRAIDVSRAGGDAGRFSDVWYELEVFEADRSDPSPTRLVYRRRDLVEPAHRIDQALTPCGRYFWTVRARFRLDGWPRVTEWTGAYEIFPSGAPWEYRRGLKSGPLSGLFKVDPASKYLPFRVPSEDDRACD